MRTIVIFLMISVLGTTAHSQELNLPDPLIAQDGTVIDTASKWETVRRPEILELFREHVYGRRPAGFADPQPRNNMMPPLVRNQKVIVTGRNSIFDGKGNVEKVEFVYEAPNGSGRITMVLILPANVTEASSVPCFLLINHRDPENIDPYNLNDFWPAEEIVSRGYAAAAFWTGNVDPDNYDEFKDGVHGQFDDQTVPRAGDAWGTISAWGWGASMCYDYLQMTKWIDDSKVALIGHSRGGKTALWAGAEDTRFGMVISNESGNSGAALARRMQGETIEKINNGFPHWFNENYKSYNGRDTELPVDQHMLAALIAPRLLYIASAEDDGWADPEGEFLSGFHAGSVYGLYGHAGLGTASFPAVAQPIHGDRIGYHMRIGKHGLGLYDWGQFMDFADKYWK